MGRKCCIMTIDADFDSDVPVGIGRSRYELASPQFVVDEALRQPGGAPVGNRHGLETDRHGVLVDYLTLERVAGCKFLRQYGPEEGKVTIAQIWQRFSAGNGVVERRSCRRRARDRQQPFRAKHDKGKLRAVDEDRHRAVRIGQEEMYLPFRQRRYIVLEAATIRTEQRAYAANVVLDLLQPVRKEGDRQRMQR